MPIPERGDIYHIDILKSEAVGHELWGSHWYVVVSPKSLNAALKTFMAVPLTSVKNKVGGEDKDHGDFRYFKIGILANYKRPDPGQSVAVFTGDSIALPESMRQLSVDRITGPRAGIVNELGLGAIDGGIQFVIGSGIHRQTFSDMTFAASAASGAATFPAKKAALPLAPAKPLPGKPSS